MVKCGVLFEVRPEFLNNIETRFGKTHLGRHMHRLDNIKMNLKDICDNVDWIQLAPDTVEWQDL
jgi:hypothetical protein